jgi:hypothetical protein
LDEKVAQTGASGGAESWITRHAQHELAQIPAGRIHLKRLAVGQSAAIPNYNWQYNHCKD